MSLVLVVGACTTGAPDQSAATTTSSTIPGSSAESTEVTVETTPPITVDRGVSVEAAVIAIGLVSGRSDDFVTGYAAYWNAQNELGGVGEFSVEVVAVDSAEQAAELDLLAITGPEQSDAVAVVPDLITSTVESILSSGNVLEMLLPGADPGIISVVVDDTSPAECREPAAQWSVVDAGAAALTEGTVAVLCTDPATTSALLSGAGDFTAVSILARAWDPSLAGLVHDSPVEVIGVLPGPGVDDAPAGELLAGALGDGPWSTGLLAGYAAARSMHAAIEVALSGGDLRRSSVIAAIPIARDLDFGFGTGIAAGRPDPTSPTGVSVEVIYPGG